MDIRKVFESGFSGGAFSACFTLVSTLVMSVQITASASTLSGDTLRMEWSPPLVGIDVMVSVGAGVDYTVGSFEFDLNAGTEGDEFLFNDNGGFFSNATAITLSGLDFSDFSVLSGFSLISTSLSNLNWSSTSDSLIFTFDSQGFGPNNGPAIHGTFVTSAVPLPGTLMLLAFGLFGLGAAFRSRTHPRPRAI